jgi:4-amino-4-deoxy-L-arabinose transferase-like glycosyltransferase
LTSLGDSLIAVCLGLILGAALLGHTRRFFSRPEAAFLVRVVAWSLALRFVGSVFVNVYAGSSYSFAEMFWGDSYTYDDTGLLLARSWSGEILGSPNTRQMVSGWGFGYFVGAVYFAFGQNQLLIQLLNGIISASAILVIYAIARDLYGPAAARWPALFMAYFPQMIFWSCAMYKDPSILLCIALAMFAVLRLRDRFSMGYVLLFVVAGLYLMSLRFYVFYMVAFAALGSFLFSQRRGLFGSLLTQSVLAVCFVGAMTFGVRRETIDQQASYFTLERLQTTRMGQVALGRSAYGAEIDVSTQEGVLTAIPVGLVYLLFAPFPWSVSGLRQVLTLPETLVWYGLMPALLRGLLFTIRTRLRDALPILTFAITLTLAYAVFQSNVGTAYRQRTQITMFFFVFIGVGIELKRQRSRQVVTSGVPAPLIRAARTPLR